MTELRDLYQEVILDHGRNPRNRRAVPDAGNKADGHNPLCGDKITVYARVKDGRIEDVGFEGSGCAISTASASMMTEALRGSSREEVDALFRAFHALVTGSDDSGGKPEPLGKLAVFEGVRNFPVRVKCATLPWHTLRAALTAESEIVTTE